MTADRAYRSAALVSREEAHRRALLLGIAALLVLSLSPVFGHHLATGLDQALHGRDHLGPVCLIAVHQLLAPVHFLFHLLLAVGVLYAAYDRAHAVHRMRRVLAPLHTSFPHDGDPFHTAAIAAGVDPGQVRIVEGLPIPAFTAGWLRPRIYLAHTLAERLTPEELTSVLAHEGTHLSGRDPLRLSILRFLALTLFWIPALRRLAADVADEAEIRADDRAARGHPLEVASAILKLAEWRQPYPELGDAVGFADRVTLIDRRIRRLAGEDPPVTSHLTRRSLACALLALSLVWASGAIMVHPLPTDSATGRLLHCDHPGEIAVSHLLCFPTALRNAGGGCPHAI